MTNTGFFAFLTLLLILAGVCLGALWNLGTDGVHTLTQTIGLAGNIATVMGVIIAIYALGIWKAQHKFSDKYQNVQNLQLKGEQIIELAIEFAIYADCSYAIDMMEQKEERLVTYRSKYLIILTRFREQLYTTKVTLGSDRHQLQKLYDISDQLGELFEKIEAFGKAQYEMAEAANSPFAGTHKVTHLTDSLIEMQQTFNDELHTLRLNIPTN